MMYCDQCNKQVDTDYDAEHFEDHKDELRELILGCIERFRKQWIDEGDDYPQDDVADDIMSLVDDYITYEVTSYSVMELKALLILYTPPKLAPKYLTDRIAQLERDLNNINGVNIKVDPNLKDGEAYMLATKHQEGEK